jgi:hypothetical protein
MEEDYKEREKVERREPPYRGRYTLGLDAARRVEDLGLRELLDDIPDGLREEGPKES